MVELLLGLLIYAGGAASGWLVHDALVEPPAPPAGVGIEYCTHARPILYTDWPEREATPEPIRAQVREGNKVWSALCRDAGSPGQAENAPP